MIFKIITKLLIVVLALFFVANYIPGIEVDSVYTALIVALILGVLNLTIRPILLILTLPITIITLGLSIFILNGILFWFIAGFIDGFEVSGFIPAITGAFIVSVLSSIGNKIFV